MHEQVANEIVEYLHLKFPNASIALAGSIANGSFNKNSDIDLLFLSKDINNSYSISFTYKDIQVSLFSFHKKIFYQNRINFLYKHHSMPISFILHSKPVHDSEKLIIDLKEEVEDIFEKRKILKKTLITELKNEIQELLNIEPLEYIDNKKIVYSISDKVVSIFFLKEHNKGALTKIDGRDPYSVIKKKDVELFKILKACLPYHEDSYKIIKDAFNNYILFNY